MQDLPTSIQELAEQCRKETKRTKTGKMGPMGSCFELFRRAIVQGSQDAWEAVYNQYRGLVSHWLGHNPKSKDDLIQCAFAKFFRAVDSELFSRFSSIAGILAYLRRCAKSVLIDAARKTKREQLARQAIQEHYSIETSTAELEVLDRIMSRECADYIYDRLKDAEERLVIHLSFELGLKPSQIAQQYPSRFSSARQVSRIKERILLRLSQDPVLQKMIE